MSTSEAAMASRLYPSMAVVEAPAPAKAPVVAPVPRENKGTRLQIGDTSAPVELPANKGMALQVPLSSLEKADAPTTPITEAQEAVTSSESSAPILTREIIDATLPQDLRDERKADKLRHLYTATYNDVVPDESPAHAPVAHEIRQALYDAGVPAATVSSLKMIAAKYKATPADAPTLASWASGTTDAEKAAFATAVARNPLLGPVLDKLGIKDYPTVVRAFGAQRRR